MEDLQRMEERLRSLSDLRALFSAMQAIAASRVQAAQGALEGIRTYAAAIETAIGDAVALQPVARAAQPVAEVQATSALVVIASEQGFVGAFNRLLLERARSEVGPADRVGVVGRRGAALAGEHGLRLDWSMPMATHVDGILGCARQLATRLADCDTIRVVFGRHRAGGHLDIEVRRVLPPEPELLVPRRTSAAPLHHLEPAVLLRRLVLELVLAELMLAMTEGFAGEHAERLRIMQSAGHNITDKQAGLVGQVRQIRQDAITSEMLEIVAGSAAVAEANSNRPVPEPRGSTRS